MEEKEEVINIADLVQIVYANWKWYILSVIVCLGLAFLYLCCVNPIYERQASVLIKDEKGSGGSIGGAASMFQDMGMFGVSRNADNEVLVYKSKRLMQEVVRRLRLDISYKQRNGLRLSELYKKSPIQVSFPGTGEEQKLSLVVTPLSADKVKLSDFVMYTIEGDEVEYDDVMEVSLKTSVETPIGMVMVAPTLYYNPSDENFGKKIEVTKSRTASVAEYYNETLQSALASKTATIINLSLQDESAERASDVLNTLIDVSNKDAIDDKNRVTVNTTNFIADRLKVIEAELGNVDTEIEKYKKKR